MLIINKGVQNTLTLNINNNSRSTFVNYVVSFTHVMSQQMKTYLIDVADNSQYGANDRYCEIVLNLQSNNLPYEGQYEVKIYGDGVSLVYVGMANVITSNEPFIEYVSDNDDNEKYIYTE